MSDVVLVHGTTQSPAGFAALMSALRARGHRVMAVDVPSAAADTAAGYAELLARQLPPDLDRPVVAAHSAGGLLLPALAQRLDARHQVWIAAVVPDFRGGRSFVAEAKQDAGQVINPDWIGLDPTTDAVAATYFLFHDADYAALRRALPTLVDCDLSAVYNAVPAEDPARIGSTYLLPTADRTLRPSWMAAAARERLGVEPVEVPAAGHNFYVAIPERTAELIDAAT
jgi:pimeloyl-ACP methyl ester carboxylesterase